MVADEGLPFLSGAAAGAVQIQVLPHGSRRDADSKLERQLMGNPFLSPGGVLAIHLADQCAEVLRQRRPPTPAGFPPPEDPECRSMPFQECFRLYDDERPTLIEKPSQRDHRGPKDWGGSVWLCVAFSDECQQLRILQVLWKVATTWTTFLRTTG